MVARAAREPVLWLVALTLAFAPRLVRLWRSRQRRQGAVAVDARTAVSAELRALVRREVERRWVALGRPRPTGRGLLEHARALAVGEGPGAPVPADTARATRDVVEAYYRARFGGERSDPAETARLRLGLRA